MFQSTVGMCSTPTTHDLYSHHVLRTVFHHLNDGDLLAAADVCSYFKQCAREEFSRRYELETKCFDISIARGKVCRFGKNQVSLHQLSSFARNFGPMMSSLKIVLKEPIYTRIMLNLLEQHCGDMLTELFLSGFEFTADSFPIMHSFLSRLRRLHLQYCRWDRTLVVSDMLSFCTDHQRSFSFPQLKSLVLAGCSDINIHSVAKFLNENPQLKEIHISGCTNITNEVIELYVRYVPNVEKI